MTRFQSILSEVKRGTVAIESVKYLVKEHDNEDLAEVLFTAVKEYTDSKAGRAMRIGKNATGSILIVALLQELLTKDYQKARHLAVTLWKHLLDKYHEFSARLFDDLILLSNDPCWPAAAFLLRMGLRSIIFFVLQHKSKPELNIKAVVFSVKFLGKNAVSFKQTETELKETIAEVRDNCRLPGAVGADADVDLVKVAQLVFGYVPEMQNFLNENALAAYRALWKNHIDLPQGGEVDYSLITKGEAEAALYIISSKLYKQQFKKYVHLILQAAESKKPAVRNEASRTLGKLLSVSSEVFEVSGAADAFRECLLTADGKALPTMIDNICKYLVQVPTEQNMNIFSPHLLRAFKHQSMRVRKAAIDGVAFILSKCQDYPLGARLAFSALLSIDDEEQLIQRAVCRFFTLVYVEPKNCRGLLDVASVSSSVYDALEKILAQTSAAKKFVCLSQAPPAARQSQGNDVENLENFCAGLELFLNSDAKRLPATRVLHLIAKVHPQVVSLQSGAIVQQFMRCSWNIANLLDQLCQILICLSDLISPEEKALVTEQATKIMDEIPLQSMSAVGSFTQLLQVLMSYLGSSDGHLKERITNGLKLLRECNPTDETKESDVKKALCCVIYLQKEFDNNLHTRKLLSTYLYSQKYCLAVLHILCQSRLHYVPTRYDPDLKKLMLNYLKPDKPKDLVIASLYIIRNTLIGYSKINMKPEMKQLGDPSTETVSMLLQDMLPSVLEHTLSYETTIRSNAAKCLKMMADSGLILIEKIIPHLVALSTERSTLVLAKTMLTTAAERWNTTTDIVTSIEYAFLLSSRLNPNTVIRGFTPTPTPLSSCRLPYELIPKARTERMKNFVEAILNSLAGTHSPRLLIYMIDQIVYLPYKTVSLVDHAVKAIAGYISNASQNDGTHMRLLILAESYMEKMYKSALKTAAKSQTGKETARRSEGPPDYVTQEILNAVDYPIKFYKLLQGENDDSEDENARKKPRKRRSSANQSKAVVAKKPNVRKSDPGPSSSTGRTRTPKSRKSLPTLPVPIPEENSAPVENPAVAHPTVKSSGQKRQHPSDEATITKSKPVVAKKPNIRKSDPGPSSSTGRTRTPKSRKSLPTLPVPIHEENSAPVENPAVAHPAVKSSGQKRQHPSDEATITKIRKSDPGPSGVFDGSLQENHVTENGTSSRKSAPAASRSKSRPATSSARPSTWVRRSTRTRGHVDFIIPPESPEPPAPLIDNDGPSAVPKNQLEIESSDDDAPLVNLLNQDQVKCNGNEPEVSGPQKEKRPCYDHLSEPASSQSSDVYRFKEMKKLKIVLQRVKTPKKRPLAVKRVKRKSSSQKRIAKGKTSQTGKPDKNSATKADGEKSEIEENERLTKFYDLSEGPEKVTLETFQSAFGTPQRAEKFWDLKDNSLENFENVSDTMVDRAEKIGNQEEPTQEDAPSAAVEKEIPEQEMKGPFEVVAELPHPYANHELAAPLQAGNHAEPALEAEDVVDGSPISSPCISRTPTISISHLKEMNAFLSEYQGGDALCYSGVSLFSTPEPKPDLQPDEMFAVRPDLVIPERPHLASPPSSFSWGFKREKASSPQSGSAMGSPDLPLKLERLSGGTFGHRSSMDGSPLNISPLKHSMNLPTGSPLSFVKRAGMAGCFVRVSETVSDRTADKIAPGAPSSSTVGSYVMPLTVLGNRLADAGETPAQVFKSEPLSQSSQASQELQQSFNSDSLIGTFKDEPFSSPSSSGSLPPSRGSNRKIKIKK